MFQVRPATLNDAVSMAQLHALVQQQSLAAVLPDGVLLAARPQKQWREAIEFSEPHLQLALDGEKVVGLVGYDRSRDQGTPQTMGEIWDMYAAPDYWGRGVGLALWDVAREALLEEGCTHVSVWVPIACERALRFFDLAGFKREPSSLKVLPLSGAKVQSIRLKRSLG